MNRAVPVLRFILCAYLLTWEPLNLSAEFLQAWPTLDARGGWAAAELTAHVLFAMLAVAGGIALWNRAPHGVTLALLGVAASTARIVQVARFSTLPHDISPDLAAVFTVAALGNVTVWSAFLTRYQDQLTDHRS